MICTCALNQFVVLFLRYDRADEAMIRDSRENSLVDTYKTTPPMSHTDSPRGKILPSSIGLIFCLE